MYSTAVGKSMMADMPRQEVEDIWSRSQIITYTPNTVSSLPELERQPAFLQLALQLGSLKVNWVAVLHCLGAACTGHVRSQPCSCINRLQCHSCQRLWEISSTEMLLQACS